MTFHPRKFQTWKNFKFFNPALQCLVTSPKKLTSFWCRQRKKNSVVDKDREPTTLNHSTVPGNENSYHNWVGPGVTRLSLEREIWGLNLGKVKLDAVLSTALHCCDISSKETVLPTGAVARSWGLQTRYTLRCITTSVMNNLIWA